jgi:transposase
VADFLGVSVRSVQRWAQARACLGESGLAARPHRGRPPKLDDEQAAMVLLWLDHSPCEFGFVTQRWTARRVAELIDRTLGVQMNPRYVSDWLGRRHVTPQVPKRSASERDEGQIRWWIDQLWPRIKKTPATPARTLLLPTKVGF